MRKRKDKMNNLTLTLSIPGVRIANPSEAIASSTKPELLNNKRGNSVSGRGWKKVQEKKRQNDKHLKKTITWAEKEVIRAEEVGMREFNKNIKLIREKKQERARLQRKETVERKKHNSEKGQVYQLVSNTKTIKKMSQKARKQLVKMPKAMFEEYLSGRKVKNLH